MEEKEEGRRLVRVEKEFIEVWEIKLQSIRRGHLFHYMQTRRRCIYHDQVKGICGKIFNRKTVAEKHLQSHLAQNTFGKFIATIICNSIVF